MSVKEPQCQSHAIVYIIVTPSVMSSAADELNADGPLQQLAARGVELYSSIPFVHLSDLRSPSNLVL